MNKGKWIENRIDKVITEIYERGLLDKKGRELFSKTLPT